MKKYYIQNCTGNDIPMFSTPYLLEMTRDECRGMLRRLELECYSNVLSVFRAQGVLNQNKTELLQSLRNVFNISQERHRAEARRVANDEKLCTIADSICGSNTYQDWLKEGRRHFPISRCIPLTSLSYISNKAVKNISKKNGKLSQKNTTSNKIAEEMIGVNTNLEKNSTTSGCEESSQNISNFSKGHQRCPTSLRNIEYPNSRIQYLYHAHNMLLKKRKDLKKLKNTSATKRKRCKSFSQSENKLPTPTDSIQSEENETTGMTSETNELQIATSKKDISVNFSKLNSQMLTQKKVILQDNSPKTSMQKTVINVNNNKFITSNNIVNILHSPKKVDLEFQNNVINDNNYNTAKQINSAISDDMLNPNNNFVHQPSIDNEISNVSFTTNDQNSNLAIKGNGNAITLKKIGPIIMRNIKLPNNIHIKGDRNKKHLSIVPSGARKVFIQPNTEFQKRFNNTNFINTIKTSQITPLNIKSTGCTTLRKITPLTNINSQPLNIRKPNMVILQTNQRNQFLTTEQTIKPNNIDTATLMPIQSISGLQKKKVVVIGSIANADNQRISSKMINVEAKSNIITEDTPVDILPISEFYIDNFNFQKVNISTEVSNNNLTAVNETIYEEEEIDTNDSDGIIGTTDWELALDQEVNKSKENNQQYVQKNIYYDENSVILSSNSNNSGDFADMSEDIIDESYEYSDIPVNDE